jgi:hypothetical protein
MKMRNESDQGTKEIKVQKNEEYEGIKSSKELRVRKN